MIKNTKKRKKSKFSLGYLEFEVLGGISMQIRSTVAEKMSLELRKEVRPRHRNLAVINEELIVNF